MIIIFPYKVIKTCGVWLLIGNKTRKKKVVKVKRKNKINTEKTSDGYSQPVDLSATFGEPFPINPDCPYPGQ